MGTQFFKIFYAGTHTSASGQALTFSEQDIDAMAAVYPLLAKNAPLVLGHPPDDGPPLGEVLGLHAKKGVLFALASVSDELTELVRTNQRTSISCAFFQKGDPRAPLPNVWCLRHIGFLDKTPPAVKGLGPLDFAESVVGVGCVNAAHFPSLLDSSGTDSEVSFSDAQQGVAPLKTGRDALHQIACRTAAVHPEFTYVDAVRIFETNPKNR